MCFCRSIEEIWSEASPKHQHVVLIFEDKASITGREVGVTALARISRPMS